MGLPDPGISRAVLRERDNIFSHEPFANYYFDPSIQIIRALPNYRFVHMVRNPANIIVSAYRYHSRPHVSSFERWIALPIRDKTNWEFNFKSLHPESLLSMQSMDAPHAQHRALLDRFSQAIASGMSLQAYYRDAPQEEGILVEAYRSWDEMKLMVDNYLQTREDPNTLHVHMEATVANFDASMRCVFNFLGESKQLDVEQALKL